ncbi:MAG TPA: 4-alpha-glucanotransferase [Phycisphaerae bacterium]|jgi:4-alpha-glucanotransferase|nr:4-alpha-glucanotransferase [Phycisphaerae bacterium]HOB75066.1 4-alpha-glucanotransferase [Phycisphaerae bacterium]HOJ53217.1 4-alpha-glucanotransferase [Phycisphaerae bacterium]HOL25181.1 4-alpha-glucanotransferase [Phycisphaerae bacterium]HPP20265.1 4-alpha-glucanotransferase [Phycisphaerae bacterium]
MSARTNKRLRRVCTADAWGIYSGYADAGGKWRPIRPRTRQAIRAAMGAGRAARPADRAAVRVLRQGESFKVSAPSELVLEGGGVLHIAGEWPRRVPLGYHMLRPSRGKTWTWLIVTPGQCYLPENLPTWGWSVQLYALRSSKSWGMGDLRDLRRLARWSANELGAGVLQVNPLCAVAPVLPQQASPYYPSSRCFRNPLYLCIDEVPGASSRELGLASLAEQGRRLNGEPHIDRDAVFCLKMEALRRIYARFSGNPDYGAYCDRQGRLLDQFATFCALTELHGPDWRSWPRAYRHPASPAVERFMVEEAGRIGFHKWLQWLLEEQFRRASAEIGIVQDLPVGMDPGGADAWLWQDVLAGEAHIGAPPDPFNTLGQDWGLPPFVAHKLRAAGYGPFAETLRANLRDAGGLRIDHAMGLFRLFWIPAGAPPEAGGYVRYPADDLLGLLALESHRHRTLMVGEDLGTVEPGMREQLAAHRVLSSRLLWFEPAAVEDYPELSLAAVTTHDLPTIAGLWTGSDLAAQRRIGRPVDERVFANMRKRLRRMTRLRENASVREVIRRTYRLLAETPSMVLVATLEDVLGVRERPNMPGTVDEWPNWCIALPKPLEAIERDPLVRAIGRTLNRRTG